MNNHLSLIALVSIVAASPSFAASVLLDHTLITYVKGHSPNGTHQDSTGDELADGIFPATGTTDFPNSQAVGWESDPKITLTYDLDITGSTLYNLDSINIYYKGGGGSAIYSPSLVEIFFSIDGGTTFSPTFDISSTNFVNDTANVPPSGSAINYLTAIPVSASGVTDVRLDITESTANSGFNNWIFLTEVQFTGTVVPEPSVPGLLGAIALGTLVLNRRRRK